MYLRLVDSEPSQLMYMYTCMSMAYTVYVHVHLQTFAKITVSFSVPYCRG